MKKVLALVSVVGMMLMFTACGKCDVCGDRGSTSEIMGVEICDDCKSEMMKGGF